MLYEFENLDLKLTEWGYPEIEGETGYQVIQVDFERAFREGRIKVDIGGITIEHEGREYKGYMFIKDYHISRFNTFPKFHLVRCETIDSFIRSGRFNRRYVFSNSRTNDVNNIDETPHVVHHDQVLRLCRNCRNIIQENINTTEDFHDIHGGNERTNETVEVDIRGYVRDWQRISRRYRKRMNFTCESCGLQIESNFDKRYIHTHHINGDKTDNLDENLQCLCHLCHAFNDATHEQNLNHGANRLELITFVNKYRTELEDLNNPYLARINFDNN